MACAIEALGMTLPYSSSIPAEDTLKMDECFMAGKAIKHLLAGAHTGPIFSST
jgi:dihydroxy-acid dehydratase